MTAADVLFAAERLLAVDGWAQGDLRTIDGRRCVLGAINKAASCGPPALGDAARRCLYGSLELKGWRDLVAWNDARGRTEAEVRAALLAAADGAA